jgi:hypothetical protein
MNEQASPTEQERIAALEAENAKLVKAYAQLDKEHQKLIAENARLIKQKPSFSTKTREERLKRQDGV